MVLPKNVEMANIAKFFTPPKGNTINPSRWKLACKHSLWVYFHMPDLAVISQKLLVLETKISVFTDHSW